MGQVTVNYVYEKTGENLVDPEVIQVQSVQVIQQPKTQALVIHIY